MVGVKKVPLAVVLIVGTGSPKKLSSFANFLWNPLGVETAVLAVEDDAGAGLLLLVVDAAPPALRRSSTRGMDSVSLG